MAQSTPHVLPKAASVAVLKVQEPKSAVQSRPQLLIEDEVQNFPVLSPSVDLRVLIITDDRHGKKASDIVE